MGGVENYGQEDYNNEDTWSDNKIAIKQKVCQKSYYFYWNFKNIFFYF